MQLILIKKTLKILLIFYKIKIYFFQILYFKNQNENIRNGHEGNPNWLFIFRKTGLKCWYEKKIVSKKQEQGCQKNKNLDTLNLNKGNWFCIPIIFNNPLTKCVFRIKNISLKSKDAQHKL